jgi:hypothetical protein
MVAGQIQGYEILREIGRGGMSRLLLAYDPARRRHVAIKLLPAEYLNDLGARARFEQEAQLIAALEHEAIVPVYEYGADQGQPYLVMAYMPNGSLADRLAHGPLPPDQAGEVLARLAGALHCAHQQGIIHRDLKPSNVLFDRDGNAFLADFGIALQSGSTWQRDMASGTPAYMSPEQARREAAVEARSDVYSLGVIVFEMLTGSLPFEGELPVAVLLKHLHDPPPAPGALNPDLPAALDPVLHRALAKDPEERYPSAPAFWEAYQRALQAPAGEAPAGALEAPGPAGPDGREPFPGPAGETAPAGSVLPAARVARPEFPDLSLLIERRSRSRAGRRQAYAYYALGLVTWLAVLLAALTAVMARARELFPAANMALVYGPAAIAVINRSNAPVDLSGIVFQRIDDQGAVTASFRAAEWEQVNPEALEALRRGDCFQLLRRGSGDLPLEPGAAPGKPRACRTSQGWLVAAGPGWHFWTPEGEGGAFQIVRDGQVLRRCRIESGACDFVFAEEE